MSRHPSHPTAEPSSAAHQRHLTFPPSTYTHSNPHSGLPTPPLSSSTSAPPGLGDDPWQPLVHPQPVLHPAYASAKHGAMDEQNLASLSGSLHSSWGNLGGSWRSSGHLVDDRDKAIVGLPVYPEIVPPLALGNGLGKGKGKEVDRGANAADMVLTIAKVMESSKGRDKVLKSVQYSLKTYLYLLSLVARVRPLSQYLQSNSKRLRISVAGLSLTRKCLLLLNPLHPLAALMSPAPTSAREMLEHLIDLVGAISDDVFCLSKLGILDRRKGRIADRWSNRFWLLTTVIALYRLHVKTIPRIRAVSKENESYGDSPDILRAEWTNRKLLSDLIFVSYDVFDLSWLREPVQCLSGLTAALISTGKLYNESWSSLGKG